MNKFYTGIGSRDTPQWALDVAYNLSASLAQYGFILRSGGAEGMDTAFESGCSSVAGKKEIYLPWKGFNNNYSSFYSVSGMAKEIASFYHPAWTHLSDGAKKLHGRNSYQVLGFDLETPSRFVVCYSEGSGGTEQALRIAKDLNIPIYNINDYNSSLWDTKSKEGCAEIIKSILGDILIVRHKLKVKKETKPFIRVFREDYDFLSNFYPSEFKYNGQSYFTVENAYQSYKTDPPSERIRVAGTPGVAKKLGRSVQLREDWEEIKDNLMLDLVKAKFSQNEVLREKLLDTGDAHLEEGNWWHDNYWGNCDCAKCENIPGENMLGEILMEVRSLLKNPPFYCKLFENYRYDGKCTEMACEFCDSYYDDQRKIWWYHPESNCVFLDTYANMKDNIECVDVNDKIKTRVVNIKKGEECDIYIGRGSKWGNPYHIDAFNSRKQVLEDFKSYIQESERLMKDILELRGKRLGCSCTPEDCHGDILAELTENEYLRKGGKIDYG